MEVSLPTGCKASLQNRWSKLRRGGDLLPSSISHGNMTDSSWIRTICREHGFPLFGVVRAVEAPRYERFLEWLEQGHHGSMAYLENRKEAYAHPSGVLDGCASLIMLGMPYYPHPETLPNKTKQMMQGVSEAGVDSVESRTESRIGNYAVGPRDYHDVIREQLNSICDVLRERLRGNYRGVVDTAPLLEREFAELAGLGWVGKNTLLLNRDWGSYFFLAAILTDVELKASDHIESDHCGSCTACLDACPTDAFPQPRVLDATRCISYLTIEHRGESDESLRSQMGDWVFGCDVCQIVCPWNRKRPDAGISWFEPENIETKTSLEHWLGLDDQTFRRLYRKTPFFRTKLAGMQRNAMVAAVNRKRVDLLSKIEPFCTHEDAILRSTADWAVKCLKGWIVM